METKLKYFDDTYELEGTATVVQIVEGGATDDEALSKALSKYRHAVVLDQTLFYPQGGGQPADTGTITIGPAGTEFAVRHVFAHKGLVYHQGEFASDAQSAAQGAPAQMRVDRDRRLRNARCHTGGHVIFSVVRSMEAWGHMRENKGHHFDDGAYVEFQGILPPEETVDGFQARIDSVVGRNAPVTVTTRNATDDGGQPVRVVQVGDFLHNPCGGTHVTNTSEIGRIVIKKVARRTGQNATKISYRIEP
ncbi:hypothetical protein EV175_000947 [Coemansia sp. RSA 1933]|nr:hypothetical protein EV175_000947 [Coemansia sp. RSA 1933]